MDASDLIKALQNTLQGGGRPHMDNHRVAERRVGDQLHCDYRHPALAASRSGLCRRDSLPAGNPPQRRAYGDDRFCGTARIGRGDLCRFQPRHRPLSCAHRGSVGASAAALAGGDVHRDDDDLYAAARADEPRGLRHGAILQWHVCDRRRHCCGAAVVSVTAAIVAGVPHAPALGADLA